MNQTVYYNGKIITMNGEQIVEAILVEDGRIREVGSNNEILNRKSPEAEVINLEGKTMLPAFIDVYKRQSRSRAASSEGKSSSMERQLKGMGTYFPLIRPSTRCS